MKKSYLTFITVRALIAISHSLHFHPMSWIIKNGNRYWKNIKTKEPTYLN
jgi:hypothetical protein